jgi:hypothetical protein
MGALADDVVVEWVPLRLATDGVFDPPQPAASRARLASPAASATSRSATRGRFTQGMKHTFLKRL